MVVQHRFSVSTGGRGAMDITRQVSALVESAQFETGVAHLFVQHTSCSLGITENADPAVLGDLETLMRRWAPDGDPAYRHDTEGDDDMAAHARSLLTGVSVSIPFTNGRLLLGTWQGVFLFEHRSRGHQRDLVLTLWG